MTVIEKTLDRWQRSLCPKIDLGGLFARSPVAHKWKATYRCLVLRKAVFWRIHDLLSQSHALHLAHHTLGSRVLLRSAFETLALLIYLNQLMKNILDGAENFHSFSKKTSRLLLGSKDKSTMNEAINIVTLLEKCEGRYPGLLALYALLSESAHPNFEGMCFGYSRVDHKNYVTEFSNNMAKMFEDKHVSAVELCMMVFEYEYDIEWKLQFDRLEAWIVSNDAALEATKSDEVLK